SDFSCSFFIFQAEDGIRDRNVTGVQTCALPIYVHKRYGSTVAVDGIDLAVDRGEILGMLGANGAGKTTLVECIAGLRAPDSGSIRVAGLDPRTDRSALTRLVGGQLQRAGLQAKLNAIE